MNNKSIGSKIARLRKQMNLSTTELARRAGLSQPQISRLENGKQGFRSETIARISKALGVNSAYFFLEQLDIVRSEQERNHAQREKLGQELARDLAHEYGEVVVTPAFRTILKRLARTLAKGGTDIRILRRLLERVLTLNNDEREALLAKLPPPRRRRKQRQT